MEDCLFCKIVEGKIPSKKVFENEYVYAFNDIHPVTPVHVLVIPKIHIKNLNEIDEKNVNYITNIMLSIKEIASILGISDEGYRVVTNVGENGGQAVPHLHFHILGGKKLGVKIVK